MANFYTSKLKIAYYSMMFLSGSTHLAAFFSSLVWFSASQSCKEPYLDGCNQAIEHKSSYTGNKIPSDTMTASVSLGMLTAFYCAWANSKSATKLAAKTLERPFSPVQTGTMISMHILNLMFVVAFQTSFVLLGIASVQTTFGKAGYSECREIVPSDPVASADNYCANTFHPPANLVLAVTAMISLATATTISAYVISLLCKMIDILKSPTYISGEYTRITTRSGPNRT